MTNLQLDSAADSADRRPPSARMPPLSDYGLIGDMRTAALIGLDGAIDWCCLPRFDSGSVFAAILDQERGGTWSIRPAVDWTSTQRYLPRTNILETTFRTAGGVAVLTDFMPVDEDGRPSGPHPEIHRQIRCTRGRVPMQMIFMPRFEYGARATRLEQLRNGLFATDRTDQVLTLSSAKPFEWTVEQSAATTRFTVEKGEERWLVLRYDDDDIHPVDSYESGRKLDITAAFWARWAAGRALQRPVPGHGQALGARAQAADPRRDRRHHRRADDLAARDHRRGAQLGLPLRLAADAAFTLAALDAVGHRREADAFMRFLKKVCRHEGGGHLQIMYGIDGRRDLVERQLDHLSGYLGSRPVRVGNGAVGTAPARRVRGSARDRGHLAPQLRDDRGHLARAPRPGGLGERELAASRLEHLGGAGRGPALRLQQGDELGGDGSRHPHGRRARASNGNTAEWQDQRETLHAEILERGWSERHQSFTQAYDDDALDAAALAIPMVRFLPWNHPTGAGDGPRRGARAHQRRRGAGVSLPALGWTGGRGGSVFDLHVLAGAGPDDDRRARARGAGVPPHVAPRQSRRALLRGDRSAVGRHSSATSLRPSPTSR